MALKLLSLFLLYSSLLAHLSLADTNSDKNAAPPIDNPYVKFLNMSLLTIYIRKKFLQE